MKQDLSRCIDCKDYPCSQLEDKETCNHFESLPLDTIKTTQKANISLLIESILEDLIKKYCDIIVWGVEKKEDMEVMRERLIRDTVNEIREMFEKELGGK